MAERFSRLQAQDPIVASVDRVGAVIHANDGLLVSCSVLFGDFCSILFRFVINHQHFIAGPQVLQRLFQGKGSIVGVNEGSEFRHGQGYKTAKKLGTQHLRPPVLSKLDAVMGVAAVPNWSSKASPRPGSSGGTPGWFQRT